MEPSELPPQHRGHLLLSENFMHLGASTTINKQLWIANVTSALERQRNNDDLKLQAKTRREKEELLQEKSEEYIDAVHYHRMYSFDACWKGDPKIVTSELGKLNSKAAKYRAIKENIMIRVKGFGLDWCKHP